MNIQLSKLVNTIKKKYNTACIKILNQHEYNNEQLQYENNYI